MRKKEQKVRILDKGNFADLKTNIWFSNFDWAKCLKQDLKAPYIPEKSKLISQEMIDQQLELNINFQQFLMNQNVIYYDIRHKNRERSLRWNMSGKPNSDI